MAGLRPVVELMMVDFMAVAFDAVGADRVCDLTGCVLVGFGQVGKQLVHLLRCLKIKLVVIKREPPAFHDNIVVAVFPEGGCT